MQKRDIYMVFLGAVIGIFSVLLFLFMYFVTDTLDNPVAIGSSSLLVKISYFVLIRKIGMIKNRLILSGIFIEMGVIEIEYELNKINVFTKSDEEPQTEPVIPGKLVLRQFW